MHASRLSILALLLSLAPAAGAQILQGRLEMQWGDRPAQTGEPSRFRVTLVDDSGRRHDLDPAQALHAAGDLHALYGRRVAVGYAVPRTHGRTKISASARIEAIVPVDDFRPMDPRRVGARPDSPGTAPRAPKVSGSTTWLSLLCKFSDIAAEPKPLSFFQSQYENAPGRLDHYWREVSYGKIDLTGSTAYDWKALPQPRSYYVHRDPITGSESADLNKLYDDCTALFREQVDQAAQNGAYGLNLMFNANLDGAAWGGLRCLPVTCLSATWIPPWAFNDLSVVTHEMGHAYGLPHANNSDGYAGDTYDNPWDLMSDFWWDNAVRDATYGILPKHLSAYSRDRLGWVAPVNKLTIPVGSRAASVTVDRASMIGSTRPQMLVLAYPNDATRYYTIEVRKRSGLFESNLVGDAVIIHEVVTTRSEPAWSVDADVPPAPISYNEGSMFKVGEIWTSPDAAFMVMIQAETADGFMLSVRNTPVKGGRAQRLAK